MAGMGTDFLYGALFLIAAIGFFVGAFVAKRKRNERAFSIRMILGVSMTLMALHDFVTRWANTISN
jgi:hypothetical protein